MSLPNSFVYMQFHPLAYIVKLKIEMSMADLITSVARARDDDHGNVFISGSDLTQTRKDNISAFNPKTGAAAVIRAFQSTASTLTHEDNSRSRAGTFHERSHSHDFELGNISRESNSTSQETNAEVGAGGFVVHRHDEVRMEYETLPPIDEDKGAKEGRRPYGGEAPSRESDETPFVAQDKSYTTKVWGSR